MDYEMKLPNGVGEKVLADVISEFNIELKHTDFGPVLVGEMDELENARDFIVKSINDRLHELENNEKRQPTKPSNSFKSCD
jgi:hypothetical protein